MSKLEVVHIHHMGLENPLRPLIVVGDVKKITNYIRDPAHKGKIKLKKTSLKEVVLDPGGMMCMDTPYADFNIQGVKFSVQYTKSGAVIDALRNGIQRVPGYLRASLWYIDLFIPQGFLPEMLAKLQDIYASDKQMHYKLDEYARIEKVEANTILRCNEIPREKKG